MYTVKIGTAEFNKKIVKNIIQQTVVDGKREYSFTEDAGEHLHDIFDNGLGITTQIYTKKVGPRVFTTEIYCDSCKQHFKCSVKTRELMKMKFESISVPINGTESHECKYKKN